MNYKVLYRKYRPDNFDSLVGQDHIVEILKNSIKENRISHAYLFSGPRGTGKTTTARILAKSINCLEPKDGLACGNCIACNSFNGNPDIIEIDAASNNGVDEIRELINNVKIMPTNLKYKVYIIDEVHMLSQSAFNALLLTLEEPPEHVVFILATTNLESVPITIISRCQRFSFRKISDIDIINRLKFICDKENIKYEDNGLKEIANLADGGLRDALSLLDQLSKSNVVISEDFVIKEIGSVSDAKIRDLIKAIDENDLEKLESVFNELENINLNYKVVIKKLIDNLSCMGVTILKGNNDYRLGYDDVKHLVIELNDLINKININVNPYVLIKMVILGYIDLSNNIKNIKEEEDINLKEEQSEKVKSEDIKQVENNIDLEILDVRINNCFAGANKATLLLVQPKWNEFIKAFNGPLKGNLSDTQVVVASEDYLMIECLIPHSDTILNSESNTIENLFSNYLTKSKKIVFVFHEKWLNLKSEYINNLKLGNKYIFKEEKINNNKSDIDMSLVSDIFDINKIEIE